MKNQPQSFGMFAGLVLVLWLSPAGSVLLAAGGGQGDVKQPDFTKGDRVPEGWTHDWTLGPTGLRGWIYSDKMVTTEARQILITKVEDGSPADGVIQVGDVVLGIGEKPFYDDPRIVFGKAITAAEREANRGELRLLRWRDGATETVVVNLPVMGSYHATAPFECSKSLKILQQGCEAIAAKMQRDPTGGHIITRALNGLALLASGDEAYYPLLRTQAQILSRYNQSTGVRTWQYAYVNLFLAEYVLATGDRSLVDTGLKRITKMVVDGQSVVGSWGHGFVREGSGRLGGYGMMNAPGIPLTYSLVLARLSGVDVPGLDEAIAKSVLLLRFYVGKGAVPYGDHTPWIQTHCDNGKNEMAAVLFDQLGDAKATEYFSRMAVASHGAERDTGHTGPFFNMLWALPGVARSGPQASGAWLEEFGWHYDLARRWDGTFTHQGPPGSRHDSYRNWDSTGAYLLGYAQSLRKTYLTGRKPSVAPQIDRTTAESLVDDGRGWTNKNRAGFYDALSTEDLIERLRSWSPTVRERAAMALGRRRDDVTDRLIRLLDSTDLDARLGACQALKMQRGRGASAVPSLVNAFRADDLWLRILAAEALAAIGEPAKLAVPEMLERLVKSDPENDPRNMEQRYLTVALFSQRGGLIGRSLEGVDRDLLVKAVRAGLLNDDGRSRGAIGSVYKNLSYEELEPLLPAILQAIAEPAPSGIMFADTIQTAGLELFSKHRISEGIELLADYARTQKQHASEKRIGTIMKMLESYGAHGQRVIPQLEATAKYFENGETDFPRRLSRDKARAVRQSIVNLQAATEKPELIYLER
ncbi:MAG: acetylesterase [Planctomycetaceae bacterium]|nr:acetylesterase [Planctomycetaceae bacterium]